VTPNYLRANPLIGPYCGSVRGLNMSVACGGETIKKNKSVTDQWESGRMYAIKFSVTFTATAAACYSIVIVVPRVVAPEYWCVYCIYIICVSVFMFMIYTERLGR